MDFASVVLCMMSSSCLFVTCKIDDFSSILVSRFCYSVCLSVRLSPTGHNSKLIDMKLYQIVEVVSTEKPIDFEVKGQRSSSGQISEIDIFHPIDLKFWLTFGEGGAFCKCFSPQLLGGLSRNFHHWCNYSCIMF